MAVAAVAAAGSGEAGGRRELLRLLQGLALALLALHLGAAWLLAGAGAPDALGSADAGPLGLMAPLQLAGLGAAAWLAAWRTGDEGLACAAAAALGLAAADAASLPAAIASLLPAGPGGLLLPGLPARRAAKLLAGALVVLPVAGLLLAAARSPDGRRLAGILLELALGFGVVAVLLDLQSGILPLPRLLLDGAEEAAEAVLASRALVGALGLCRSSVRSVRHGTIFTRGSLAGAGTVQPRQVAAGFS